MTSRRNLILAAAAGIAASGATYAATGVPQPDPVLALVEEADRLYRQTQADLAADWDGLGQTTFDAWHAALTKLFSTPATTLAGLAAQLEAYWRTWATHYGQDEPDLEDARVRHLRSLIDAAAAAGNGGAK